MAEAPGHRLGQIIGDALELALEPVLRSFAESHDLYLDMHGPRPARSGRKCTWVDGLGNSHDLDFVLERGGSPDHVGLPAAFVETAWRRYTKHSRAKAQEIQGAVLPLLTTYASVKPFAGAVVAGNWTKGALQQMLSSGLEVLHISYEETVAVFANVGVDIDIDEDTPDSYLQDQVDEWEALDETDKELAGDALRACDPEGFARFQGALEATILRAVERITVLPLHGVAVSVPTVAEAISVIRSYVNPSETPSLVRFEVSVRYSNGDRIVGEFAGAADAIDFLETFGGPTDD
jgi:hypothetical protein